MRKQFYILCLLCLVTVAHGQIIKEYPKQTLNGEVTSFNYIESRRCSFDRKDIRRLIQKELKRSGVNLSTGDWLHVPDECWNIKSFKRNLLLISFTNKNKPLRFYIIDDGKTINSVMLNRRNYQNLSFDQYDIQFSKQVDDGTKKKILMLFKQLDQESKGEL